MRTLGRALAAAVLGLLAGAPLAQAGLADRIADTFGAMADDFIKTWEPLEGLVLEREGERIYLDVGHEAGVRVGQELTVFRKGEPFYHPVTGKPLGRYEDVLGYAQVRRVEARFSEALFIPAHDQPPPRPEDGVRISRGRIRVAVAPILDLSATDADVRRVPYLFALLLERSKRFQVVDPLLVSDTIAASHVRVGEILARPERAVPLGRTLDVAAWLVPVLLRRGGVTYLDATWVSAVTGTALFSRREPLQSVGSSEEPRFPWEPRPED